MLSTKSPVELFIGVFLNAENVKNCGYLYDKII